ncbi:hypothetical protein ACGFIK_02120 [Micromonospora sp. NPDC048871]|uniref:hypothetical protein n=1 Tax=unclassified Micromonospora TaxID=2617518 RepID=UPI002E13F98E|nr:hypothetical protein OIE53_15910 [Micromonospora sp. NBC_01739]
MSHPSNEEVVAAFEAIHQDAANWRRSADTLNMAAAHARSLNLSGTHLGYLADSGGVTSKYQEVQDLAVRLLTEGARAMQEMAGVLVSVVEDYQYTDAEASISFKTIGEPK